MPFSAKDVFDTAGLSPRPGQPAALYTLPYSLTGYPCVVVRAGTSPEGLPIGVQGDARPWREDMALAGVAEAERVLGRWRAPAPRCAA